ncbi:MAG: hypothetical protein A2020_05035 [Lentisphaerae bacterium GWF2_45_14]|nr:MAG: hypothetical protein A2020_05035 [Lentisphaerae bacterium GWF2_45_14]
MTRSINSKLPRREVAILILYDENERMLLQKRTADAPVFPGVWGFFGGGIESGESPLEALKREIYEELEYEIANPGFLLEEEYCHKDPPREIKRSVFIEFYDSSQKLVLHEGERMGWFTHEETLKIVDIPSFNRPILRAVSLEIESRRSS